MAEKVKVGIVGLGRWARVLTRASRQSSEIEIVKGFSRSAEKRDAFQAEYGVPSVGSLEELLADPEIKGCILTVPNEQHLPVAEAVARAGKHIYTEKPIANTLENGIRLEALQTQYGVRAMVGHSARLLRGARMMKEAIEFRSARHALLRRIELLERTRPRTHPRHLALVPRQGAGRPALAACDAPLRQPLHAGRRDRGGLLHRLQALSRGGGGRRPVDDLAPLQVRGARLRGVRRWTAPGIYFIRVYGQKGLMHFELDFGRWDDPDTVHETSTLYIQRGKDGYGKREVLDMGQSNMFTDELDMFAQMCRTGEAVELEAANGIVALAIVNAALVSVDRRGQAVKLAEIIDRARARVADEDQSAA